MKQIMHHKNYFHDFKAEWRIEFEKWSGLAKEAGFDGYSASSKLVSESLVQPEVFFLYTELLEPEGLDKAKAAIADLKAKNTPLIVLTDLSKSNVLDEGPQSPNDSIFDEKELSSFFKALGKLEAYASEQSQKIAYQPHLSTGIQNFSDIKAFLENSKMHLAIDTVHLLYLKIFNLPKYLTEIQSRIKVLILQDYTPCTWSNCRRQQYSYFKSLETKMFRHPANAGVKIEKLKFLFSGLDYLILAGETPPDLSETTAALRTSLALVQSVMAIDEAV